MLYACIYFSLRDNCMTTFGPQLKEWYQDWKVPSQCAILITLQHYGSPFDSHHVDGSSSAQWWVWYSRNRKCGQALLFGRAEDVNRPILSDCRKGESVMKTRIQHYSRPVNISVDERKRLQSDEPLLIVDREAWNFLKILGSQLELDKIRLDPFCTSLNAGTELNDEFLRRNEIRVRTWCDGFRNNSIASRNSPVDEDLSRCSTGIVRRYFLDDGMVEEVSVSDRSFRTDHILVHNVWR